MKLTKGTAAALLAVFLLAIAGVGFADKTEELVGKASVSQGHEGMTRDGRSQGVKTPPMDHDM